MRVFALSNKGNLQLKSYRLIKKNDFLLRYSIA